MSEINDGGPAFPDAVRAGAALNMTTHFNEGMSMRDWFAGHALAYMATVATHENVEAGGTIPAWSKEIAEALASDAYAIADAMLAERTRR